MTQPIIEPMTAGEPSGAIVDPREELLIRFTAGHAVTDLHDRYFRANAKIFTLDDTPDGHYEGTYELTTAAAAAFDRPPQPVGPFDEPVDPVEHVAVNAHTKGLWTFADGSSLAAVGPANFHATYRWQVGRPWRVGRPPVLLWLTGIQIITSGTGRFAGASGLKTIGGSGHVPSLPPERRLRFPARSVDMFRIVRAEHIAQLPGPPGP